MADNWERVQYNAIIGYYSEFHLQRRPLNTVHILNMGTLRDDKVERWFS